MGLSASAELLVLDVPLLLARKKFYVLWRGSHYEQIVLMYNERKTSFKCDVSCTLPAFIVTVTRVPVLVIIMTYLS